MKYKINIKNGGGEYTFGAVTNEDDIAAIHTAIENDEVYCSIETDDDLGLDHFDLDDMLLQTYGPDVQAANILVASFPSDTDDSDVDYDDGEVIIDDNIDETDVPVFTASNPWYKPEQLAEFPEDTLLWGNEKIEKRITFPTILTLPDDEEFVSTNLFVGTVNTDETVQYAEIVSSILYINEETQKNLAREYYKDDEDVTEDDLLDLFQDFLSEEFEAQPALFEEFVLEVGDVEGKGESENDYNIISTKDNTLLYEGGEY